MSMDFIQPTITDRGKYESFKTRIRTLARNEELVKQADFYFLESDRVVEERGNPTFTIDGQGSLKLEKHELAWAVEDQPHRLNEFFIYFDKSFCIRWMTYLNKFGEIIRIERGNPFKPLPKAVQDCIDRLAKGEE